MLISIERVEFYEKKECGSPNGAVTVPQYGLENVVLDEEYVYCQEKEDSIITLKKIIVTI